MNPIEGVDGCRGWPVVWTQDPFYYLGTYLPDLARQFADFDPQKVGKNADTYKFMVSEVEKHPVMMRAGR